jgi:hypothetical protein
MPLCWLGTLKLELDSILEFIEPINDIVEEEDEIIGEMDDDLKRLYTLWQETEKVRDQYKLDIKHETDRDRSIELSVKYGEIKAKTRVLKGLFWISVFDEFNLWNEESFVYVCRGFFVVKHDTSKERRYKT